jgi:hypothetical protein
MVMVSGGASVCIPAVTVTILVIAEAQCKCQFRLPQHSAANERLFSSGGRVLLPHSAGTCTSLPVHSTVTRGSYVVLIHLNDDAGPRRERQHFPSSSSRCLGSLVRKSKAAPENSSNQVITAAESVTIEKESKCTVCSRRESCRYV